MGRATGWMVLAVGLGACASSGDYLLQKGSLSRLADLPEESRPSTAVCAEDARSGRFAWIGGGTFELAGLRADERGLVRLRSSAPELLAPVGLALFGLGAPLTATGAGALAALDSATATDARQAAVLIGAPFSVVGGAIGLGGAIVAIVGGTRRTNEVQPGRTGTRYLAPALASPLPSPGAGPAARRPTAGGCAPSVEFP